MPSSLRHRAQALDPEDTDSEIELNFGGRRALPSDLPDQEDLPDEEEEGEEEEDDDELVGDEELEEDEDPGAPQTPLPNLDPPPPYLREISTLASWTVSSSKPGCSIPQLRHASTSLFWQSDGPQPHYLNIHFFKLVRIVGLRLYLDFEQDESYTPTRIVFLAGSGMNDLQEWGEMKLESPRGWVWADFSNVDDDDDEGDEADDGDGDARMLDPPPPGVLEIANGGRGAGDASSDSENNNPQQTPIPQPQLQNQTPQTHQQIPSSSAHQHHVTPTLPRPHPRQPFTSLPQQPQPPAPQSPRRPHMPVLRAHLVQIKILENHQNGKDTHLRGLQIFARNDETEGQIRKRRGDVVIASGKGRDMKGGGGKKGSKHRASDAYEELELGGLDDGGIR
jgi:anaphase-promoting complex subunit 10